MKRYGNLWEPLISLENLREAHRRASKGKAHYREVKMVNSDVDHYLGMIRESLRDKTFTTSEYTVDTVFDGRKVREVHKLPYFPDRIVHHAILNITHGFLFSSMIRDTFQSLPGRGTSDAARRVKSFVRKNRPGYALKIDVHKFYPSVGNSVIKRLVSRKIKCKDTLWLFYDIIDSVDGLPIGNFSSQLLGNLCLTPFDWYMKQEEKVRGYFRYCDDILVFGDTPRELVDLQKRMVAKLRDIGLTVKPDWIIYNVTTNGADFVGYNFKPGKTRLRKKIAKGACKSVRRHHSRSSSNRSRVMSYKGWILPTNSHGLITKNIDPRLRNRYRKQLRSLHEKRTVRPRPLSARGRKRSHILSLESGRNSP